MTIYTKDLADLVCKTSDLPKEKGQAVVEIIAKAIVDQVMAGNKVFITGLGSFNFKEKKARKARNPKTGATVDVAAYNKFEFVPVKELRKIAI